MKQASLSNGVSFDACTFEQDFLAPAEVDVCWRYVFQALVVAPMIVVIDEGCDLRLQITRQVIVFQQDAVLECLVPALEIRLLKKSILADGEDAE